MLCLILIMGLYQSESSRLCAKKINDIDKTLKKLGSPSYFNDIYKRTITYITITVSYIGIFFAMIILTEILRNEPINRSSILYYSMFLHIYGYIIENLLVMEFVTIVRCINSEFQRANELLGDVNVLPIRSTELKLIEVKKRGDYFSKEKSLSPDGDQLFSDVSSLSSQTQSQLQIASQKISRSKMLLRTIRQVHLELYKVSKSLSTIYGIQISLEMAACVILTTYIIYRSYEKYQKKHIDDYEMFYQYFILIMLLLQYSTKIFIIDYTCDKTTKQAERTSEIIHTFYGLNTDLEIKEEVDIFSLQMMQCRTTYSAFGFYNLNCKHICSCIGIITTYMVIIIQVTDSIKYGS
ncbi:PREDICTED: uncharacterized protein LOC107069172 isoform X2 [Polistes dominula]|nr:PREDICTED: uncharacterized protein LOC107069172 isoform X2 [Polistes dominula]XP_015181726.1 PREDICTED: uncharacterized protein LOC107069172 isoform X2 [Polistes dominula]